MARGIAKSEREVIEVRKQGIVKNSATGWLLCRSCANRARVIMSEFAGNRPGRDQFNERMSPDHLVPHLEPENDGASCGSHECERTP
jgi:hypothetical protein